MSFIKSHSYIKFELQLNLNFEFESLEEHRSKIKTNTPKNVSFRDISKEFAIVNINAFRCYKNLSYIKTHMVKHNDNDCMVKLTF